MLKKKTSKVWNENSSNISPNFLCEIFDKIQLVPFLLLINSEIEKEKWYMFILAPTNLSGIFGRE